MKRDISHRQIFERIGKLEGQQRARYAYDRERDRSEDIYRKRALKMILGLASDIKKLAALPEEVADLKSGQKRLDGLPKRVSALEKSKTKIDGWELRGKIGWKIIRGIAITAVCAVILVGAGFLRGLEIVGGWFIGK